MPKQNTNTANYGAAQERAAIKRFVIRNRKYLPPETLIKWIDARAERASKVEGGLGRR